MKKIAIFLVSVLFVMQLVNAQTGVSISNNNADPDPSAILDVQSTDKGVLLPRMTEAQLNAIATPATGLMVYQTDATAGFYFYDGTAWQKLTFVAAPIPIVDGDGNVYTTVVIGTQTWLKENLKTTKYNDGNAIPNVTNNATWTTTTTPAYAWYNNDEATYKATYAAILVLNFQIFSDIYF